MDKQVVIARYKESIDWIEQINCDYIIYDKSDEDLPSDKNIIKIPNDPINGREAHTYLYHIINNYNNLAEQTIFVQGDPIYHCPKIIDFINDDWCGYFRTLGTLCVCLGTDWFLECETFYKHIFNKDFPTKNWHTPGAQMQVSKEIILSNPIELYQEFFDLLVRLNTKESAIFMELIWKDIFLHKHPYIFKKYAIECLNSEYTTIYRAK